MSGHTSNPAPLSPPSLSLPSTVHQTITLSKYRDRVPVVLVFLGNHRSPAPAVASLDSAMVEFGHRRVQLLVVAVGPMSSATALAGPNTAVPVLADGDGSVTAAYEASGTTDDVQVVVIDQAGSLVAQTSVIGRHPAAAVLELVDQCLGGRRPVETPMRARFQSNSPIVIAADGSEVNVEEWDPMPESLRALDHVDESTLSDPMEGPAPTG